MTARMYYDSDADPEALVRAPASPCSATARRATRTR